MNRRTFIADLTGIAVSGGHRSHPGTFDDRTDSGTRITELAGFTLPALRERYHGELFGDFLPFMEAHVIDPEFGGFICNLKPDGSYLETTKNLQFQGRGIWVYSFLYNHFGRKPHHLDVARKSVDLIMKSKPSGGDELWPAVITRDGHPAAPPPATIGGDMAIAEGLAEFSKATGNEAEWDAARQIVLKCVRVYDRADYAPDVVSLYHGPAPVKFPGARSQGAAMLLIGTISQMLAMREEPQLAAILDHFIRAVLDKHYNAEFQLNNELLNHDYSRPQNELAQFVYLGHCIETSAVILREAERIREQDLFHVTTERFRRHFEVAWDEVYGGAFRSLNNVDLNRWELNKVLWEQEEALNAALLVIEHTGAPWARELFGRVLRYVNATYYAERWGTRFWISGGGRKVKHSPNLTRVEHYHHPRHLMYSILILNRLISREGRVSEIASQD